MDNVVKLKNLLVSACDAVQKGNKDIAVSLLEVAADVMEHVDPEVIETQFILSNDNNASPDETLLENAHLDEDMPPEVAKKSLNDILNGWNIPHASAV
jgi:hypothetical protein